MRNWAAIVLLGAALAACDGGKPAASGGNTAAPAQSKPDPVEAQFNALPDYQQKVALYRAIIDADFNCKRGMTAVSKPRDNGRPVWLATCDNGAQFTVTLQPGGIFTVTGGKQVNPPRFPKATDIPEVVNEMMK